MLLYRIFIWSTSLPGNSRSLTYGFHWYHGRGNLNTNKQGWKSLLSTRPHLSIPAGKGMDASLLLGVVESILPVKSSLTPWGGKSHSHYSWKWKSSLPAEPSLTLPRPGNWTASLQHDSSRGLGSCCCERKEDETVAFFPWCLVGLEQLLATSFLSCWHTSFLVLWQQILLELSLSVLVSISRSLIL